MNPACTCFGAFYADAGLCGDVIGMLQASIDTNNNNNDGASNDGASNIDVLPSIEAVLRGLNFSTMCTEHVGYIPRTWALPVADTAADAAAAGAAPSVLSGHLPPAPTTSLPWKAWRAYFTPSPPYVNGTGPHGVYTCETAHGGAEGWLWQGGSSRDTYLGVLFGLGSTVMMLDEHVRAHAHEGAHARTRRADDPAEVARLLALAQLVFERIFDKLKSDAYFLVPPPNCVKGNEEQCTFAAPLSMFTWPVCMPAR